MSVEFKDEQYGAVARALVAIAAGKRYAADGKLKTIPREALIQLAREACQAINLHYLGEGLGTSSFPEEVGLQYRPRRVATKRGHGVETENANR